MGGMAVTYHVDHKADEAAAVDTVLARLKSDGVVADEADYARDCFEALRREVKATFEVPDTTISPVMERLLYMLACVRRPRRIVALGVFCGNTLVWNVGPTCGSGNVFHAECCVGVDIKADAIALAKKNFAKLPNAEHVELLTEDGLDTCRRIAPGIDYLYLDADDKTRGKGLYLLMLNATYPKLADDAWVLAHDTRCPRAGFSEQFKEYLAFVRDPVNFRQSISFDVDEYGLELSIR